MVTERQRETKAVVERNAVESAKKRQSPVVAQFLQEVVELGKKYGLSLSHEDAHGAFQVNEYNADDDFALRMAEDKTDIPLRTK